MAMTHIESEVRLDTLLEAAQRLSFWLDGSGAEMAVVPNGGIPLCVRDDPTFVAALEEIKMLRGRDVLHIMVNRLLPGVDVPVHRDFLLATPLQSRNHPTIERWHLPVVTNADAQWWDEDFGFYFMEPGFWYGPVPYWRRHKVYNKGHTERIHLVVDLDTGEHIGEYSD